jgi:hypothetical protein
MSRQILATICILYLFACNSKPIEMPIWLNTQKNISLPSGSLSFQSNNKNWKAILLSAAQPIPLQINYTGAGFTIWLRNHFGVTEGPAHLILSHKQQQFVYAVNLCNDTTRNITTMDYRSPKTVNPDSSLVQQQILHSIDTWRNLIAPQESGNYFEAHLSRLTPTAGTFRAQTEKPITAYYVQPGTINNIEISATYNKAENVFIATTKPLKDKHNNIAANGTSIFFIYTDGQKHFQMETSLQNGRATARIPANGKTYLLYAKANELFSSTIALKAK